MPIFLFLSCSLLGEHISDVQPTCQSSSCRLVEVRALMLDESSRNVLLVKEAFDNETLFIAE